MLWGHTAWAEDVTFTPDGTRLLSIDTRAGVKVWNVAAPTGDFRPSDHSSSVYDICFDSTGTHLVSCSYSAQIHLWDVKNGRMLRPFRSHAGSVNGLALNADDQFLASASSDGNLRLHNMEDSHTKRIRLPDEDLLCTSISPDSQLVAVGTRSGRLVVFDRQTRKPVSQTEFDNRQPVRRV